MIYEIINPSDAVTIEASDEMIACVSALVLGEGAYGLQSEDDRDVLPVFLFGGLDTWLAEKKIDIKSYISEHLVEIATCLESAVYGKIRDRLAIIKTVQAAGGDFLKAVAVWNDEKRTSLSDIGGRAQDIAAILRKRAA